MPFLRLEVHCGALSSGRARCVPLSRSPGRCQRAPQSTDPGGRVCRGPGGREPAPSVQRSLKGAVLEEAYFAKPPIVASKYKSY